METAMAALAQESDTDLEETDVQEILLAYKESRQLRREQRVNSGFKPVTGAHQWRETPSRVVQAQYRRADLTYTLPPLS